MTNSAQKPPSSVVIQQPPQDQAGTPNVVHVQVVTTNNMATTSFIFGILSFLLFGFTIAVDEYEACLFIWFTGLLAVIFGHIGAAGASRTGLGKGLAISGLILGYVTLLIYVGAIIFILLLLQSLGN